MKIKSSILFLTLTSLLSVTALQAVNNGGVWEDPITTSTAGTNRDPQLAIDCNGNVVVVWRDTTGDTIVTRRYDAASATWQDPITISTSTDNVTPQIAIDCNGNVVVVWNRADVAITTRRYNAASATWEDPFVVATGENNTPQLAIDCNGNVVVVWRDEDEDDTIVTRRYNAASATWQNPITVSTGTDNYRPQIAIDCNGNVVVVWYNSVDDNIFAARYNATTESWTDPEDISDPVTDDNRYPEVAIDCNGNVVVVWSNSTDDNAYAARYNAATGTWGDPKDISDPITPDSSNNPKVAIDCNGNAIVVWYTVPVRNIYSSRYVAATETWTDPENISDPFTDDNTAPQIAIDCNGNAICVWSIDNLNLPVYSARYNAATGTWQAPEAISDPVAGTNWSPQIAIDCNGNAIVVWYNYTDKEVYTALFDAVPAPSNIQTRQELHRFATQGDLVNVLSWDAVSFQNPIAKYKIKCTPYVEQTPCCENCCDCKIRCCVCPCTNAPLIGEVSASCPLVFNHHNRCYGQRTTYCLTAVDNQGNETPVPVSITVPAV